MEHAIYLPIQRKGLGNILANELELRMPSQMRQITLGAGQKIVKAHHCVPFGHQAVAHVRADEPCGSGYDNSQMSDPPRN
jgi:hypothetical protein